MARRKRGATLQRQHERQPLDLNWDRILKQATVVVVLVLVVSISYYLDRPSSLPVKHVTVDGEIQHTGRDSLVQAVSPYVRGSFMDVDVANIQKAGESLPWVKQVQVTRVWPDTLHLIVKEHTAVARWNENGLVSETGDVFYPQAGSMPDTSHLLWLNGPQGTSELMAKQLKQIQKQVDILGLKITTISMDERRSVQLDFDNGLHLKLGHADSDERLARFIDLYGNGLKQFDQQIKAIDMRYTNGLAVVWKAGQKPDFNGKV